MAATISTIFLSLTRASWSRAPARQFDLTVQNTASSSYALTVMTIVAVVFFPLVLVYQGWTYYVFRRRLSPPLPPPPVPGQPGSPEHRAAPVAGH